METKLVRNRATLYQTYFIFLLYFKKTLSIELMKFYCVLSKQHESDQINFTLHQNLSSCLKILTFYNTVLSGKYFIKTQI